jgi:diguanylate cyclase (GGDEF)-like protein
LLPADGIACRFGGDEFIVALPRHNLEQARTFAEQLRLAVAAHPYVYENIALRPAISIGVAQFPVHAADAEALFRSADAALYTAKRNGKNRVECA